MLDELKFWRLLLQHRGPACQILQCQNMSWRSALYWRSVSSPRLQILSSCVITVCKCKPVFVKVWKCKVMLVYLCELYRVLLLIKRACTKVAVGRQMLSLYVHWIAPTGTGLFEYTIQLKLKWCKHAQAACVTANHVLAMCRIRQDQAVQRQQMDNIPC